MEITDKKVQVQFKENNKYGTYQDTIVFAFDDIKNLSDDEILALVEPEAQVRIDAWIERNENPQPTPERTDADIQLEIDSLEAKKAELEQEKVSNSDTGEITVP